MKITKKFPVLFLIMLTFIFSLTSCVDSNVKNKTSNYEGIKIHYIDVGQGDSELIQVNGKNLLIDAGPNSSKEKLVSYLEKQNIKKFDVVVATHPDEDHIGGMADVLKNYNVTTFYAPRKTVNTRTFEDMILELKKKNMKINVPVSGSYIDMGKNTKVQVLAPNSNNYSDTNNYSIVIKITYGNNSFLFTGDAEKNSEMEIIRKNYDISSDVLKVGHHGSSTSTSKEFINKVNPSIAIISCGKNNKYGHPSKQTMNRLKNKNIKIYRTDVDGTIILKSNGNTIIKEQ